MLGKPKFIPGFGIAMWLCIWAFTHLTESLQQALAYTAVVAVIVLIAWAYWKASRPPKSDSEPPIDPPIDPR